MGGAESHTSSIPPWIPVCPLEMLAPMPGLPMVLPAASYVFPAHLAARGGNNSPFRADEDCACRDVSAPLITRTWERPRASGLSRIFALPAWEDIYPETTPERSCHQQYRGMGLQSGSGRHTAVDQGGLQQLPRQLVEAEQCCQAGGAGKQRSL